MAKIVPAINQIENHPALPQTEIVDLCKEKGIHVVAYSPLGSTGSPLQTAEPVVKLAEKKGVSPFTILLSHHSECLPLPSIPSEHVRKKKKEKKNGRSS